MWTLYNVISSDGFIARKGGSEDFIPDSVWTNFLTLCKEHGTLIMGRKTYDAIQKYGNELLQPFERLPLRKVVISEDKNFLPKSGYVTARSPEEALVLAPHALVSSGPTLNNFLLRNGFVQKIILHEVPVAIGEGIAPFDRENISLAPSDDVVQKFHGVEAREFRVIGVGT